MIVQIKDWDLMEETYGIDSDGCINTPYIFSPEFEKLLPKDRKIDIVETSTLPDRMDTYYFTKYVWYPNSDFLDGIYFNICKEMIVDEKLEVDN